MIERICKNCNKKFLKRRRSLKITNQDFCSIKCFNEYRLTHSTNNFILENDICKIIIKSKKYGIKEALIDIQDYDKCKTYSWVVSKHENVLYIVARDKVNSNNKNIYLQSFILSKYGKNTVDHINGNTFDNRKQNLRICSQSLNNYNRTTKLGKCEHKYISFDNRRNKYRVNLYKNKKQIFIGYFDKLREAIKARDKSLIGFEFKDYIKL